MTDFNPYSLDAQLSKILQRLDDQDRNSRQNHQELKAEISGLGPRITTLERSHWKQRGIVAVIAAVIPMAWEYLTKRS